MPLPKDKLALRLYRLIERQDWTKEAAYAQMREMHQNSGSHS